jgi:hypothetical protein
MAKVQDILLDENLDPIIKNGDFVIGPSDDQHIELILRAAPGHFKQFPLLGANVTSMVNGIIDGNYRKLIRLQLQSDGYKVNEVSYINDKLNIDAER